MTDSPNRFDKEIAGIIEDYRPDQYDDVIRDREPWPYFYHLSSLRRGLLNWYPFAPSWRVLEADGGFGALTGCLLERTAGVDVLQPDPLRARAIRTRYGSAPGLRVREEDLSSPNLEEGSYDCVVLLDRLEAAGDAAPALLRRCSELLKPGGILLLGFRNRFGMKYLCGAVDEVQEAPFAQFSPAENRLFTRRSVDAMAAGADLRASRYYYPLPDQAFPQAVYTDSVENAESIRDRVFPFDAFASPRIADERALYDDMIHEGLLPGLANYYLAEFQKETASGEAVPAPREVDFAALSTDRGREHGFATVCYTDGTVEKRALAPEGAENLRLAFDNLDSLSRRGILTVAQEWTGDAICMPRVRESSSLAVIRERMRTGREAVLAVFDLLREDILRSSELEEIDDRTAWINWQLGKDQLGPVLAEGLIDMIPYNAFWADGRLRYYDQEFRLPHCPVGYILFRALRYTWLHIPELEQLLPLREMKERFGLTESWAAYQRREDVFVAGNRNWDRFAQVYRWADAATSEKRLRRAREALTLSEPRERDRALLEGVHRVQLELLKELTRVCREHGIRYYAIHGTLLGAVRHAGFVPWDDDVDIALPREDYDRLLALPQTVWNKPFVLQTPENEDECFYGGYAKLRNSETTAIEPQNRGRGCDQGIWIDLLPLDRCPEEPRARRRLETRIALWQRLLLAKLYKPEAGMLTEVDPKILSFYYLAARCLRRRWILRRLDRLFRSCKASGRAAILACHYGPWPNRNVFPEEAFAETRELPFEDITVPVPEGYDTILSERYGSHYMDLPPEGQRYRHGKVRFEVDRSWRKAMWETD